MRRARPLASVVAAALLAGLAVVGVTPSAGSATLSTGGFTTSASASPPSAAPGAVVTLTVPVRSDRSTRVLVDVEVHGPGGAKVHQQVWDSQSFKPGQTRTYRATWNVPAGQAAGTYRVKVGIFGPGWSGLRHWNDDAGRISVVTASTTTAPAPTTTAPAPTTTVAPPPSPGLPPLPAGWGPGLELGMTDPPGGAAALRATAPFGYRYQYLAGGVNTGSGWATWNTDGQFVTWYVQDSRANGTTPVFTYYQIFHSSPGRTMGEPAGVYTNLSTPSTMAAYYRDLILFFQRAGAAGGRTVLHVEPDLWGYLQQRATGDDPATVPVSVASSGVAEVAGLPDHAGGFARAVVALRDRYAPNVQLAYHYSTWGTRDDFLYSNPSDAVVDALGARTATFYRRLAAGFDLAFHDIADRDAGFKQAINGDGGASWLDAADYRRSARYVAAFTAGSGLRTVLWQMPLGNTRMRAMDGTWNHYQDNKVEVLLDDPARATLGAYARAGVVAVLWGRGADGATCACDANRDGVTNPAPINGNDRLSLSADDDGGFFREVAARYYAVGRLPL